MNELKQPTLNNLSSLANEVLLLIPQAQDSQTRQELVHHYQELSRQMEELTQAQFSCSDRHYQEVIGELDRSISLAKEYQQNQQPLVNFVQHLTSVLEGVARLLALVKLS